VTVTAPTLARLHRAGQFFCWNCKLGHSKGMSDEFDGVLASVGPRLRELRRRRGATLTALSHATGIAVSTLSRLESGQRKPGLELLLPLAAAYQVPLDELVGAPVSGDPRIYPRSFSRNGMTVIPLTPRKPGGLQVFKHVLPARPADFEPDPRSHEGYHWLYVLDGRLRVVLGDQDFILASGEVAEFDTHLPHWFGSADAQPAEFLSILGPQGERFHIRARYQPGPLMPAGDLVGRDQGERDLLGGERVQQHARDCVIDGGGRHRPA
jgi:transcriptional regulator with XRE-family HTH domain